MEVLYWYMARQNTAEGIEGITFLQFVSGAILAAVLAGIMVVIGLGIVIGAMRLFESIANWRRTRR